MMFIFKSYIIFLLDNGIFTLFGLFFINIYSKLRFLN